MNNIRQLRDIYKLTQVELAKKLGLTDTTISKYELGNLDISTDALIKMSEIFSVSTDYILGIKPQISNEKFHSAMQRILFEGGYINSLTDDVTDEQIENISPIFKKVIEIANLTKK